jgi:hypothetical protein
MGSAAADRCHREWLQSLPPKSVTALASYDSQAAQAVLAFLAAGTLQVEGIG